MTRYYFYSSAEDELEIIEAGSLESFAAHEFDTSMIFTGVVVEAQDFETALKVYQNPSCNQGEYMMTDEPVETVTRRQIANAKNSLQQSFESVSARLDYLRALLKLKTACLKMQEANRLLNEASEELFNIHKKPKEVPLSTIFERLSDTAIKATIKFYGDTKKSG